MTPARTHRPARRSFHCCLPGSRSAICASTRLSPEVFGNWYRRDLIGRPPGFLFAVAVQRPVMGAAERDGELIADLAAEGAGLCKSQVVRVAGLPPADEARLG